MSRFSFANRTGALWPWLGLAAILLFAPWLFTSDGARTLLAQAGIWVILCLSYNILLGQGGMLSFGHAVYSGLGAFVAAHCLNLSSVQEGALPVSLIPLVGGGAGMVFGIVSGYLITRKSGMPFAMITLGLAELIFSCALMFPDFFGGEAGVSTNRVTQTSWAGITYATQLQMYGLVAVWVFLSAWLMHALTLTPFGRILTAVRDNAERVQFLGLDPRRIRFMALVFSSFFAGIAGALAALQFEIVSAENVGAARSGSILLFTFIGGMGVFWGPILGACVGVLLMVVLPEWTDAWQLYLGLFFIVLVLFAPNGLAGVLVQHARLARHGRYARLLPVLAPWLLSMSCLLLVLIACVEFLYQRAQNQDPNALLHILGWFFNAHARLPWLLLCLFLCIGATVMRHAHRRFMRCWQVLHEEIDAHAQERT